MLIPRSCIFSVILLLGFCGTGCGNAQKKNSGIRKEKLQKRECPLEFITTGKLDGNTVVIDFTCNNKSDKYVFWNIGDSIPSVSINSFEIVYSKVFDVRTFSVARAATWWDPPKYALLAPWGKYGWKGGAVWRTKISEKLDVTTDDMKKLIVCVYISGQYLVVGSDEFEDVSIFRDITIDIEK